MARVLTPTPPPVTVELEEAPLPPVSVQPVVVPEPDPVQVAPPRRLRRLAMTVAALALFVGAALAAGGAPQAVADVSPKGAPAAFPAPEPSASPLPAPAAPPRADPLPAAPRADALVQRTGHASIPGGVLFMPETFASADGAYDLYLHFHGNTRVVLESAEYAGLNAAVAVVNLGVNSAPYLDAYEVPGTYEQLLASIDHAVGARGLAHPHLRRVAWGSWSGGYGAISRIFEIGRGLKTLDAIFVLDGIHCGYLEENPRALNVGIISPFLDAAKQAAEGKFLFSITHSEIDPGLYAGTSRTAGYLLDAVHGQRGEPGEAPEHVQLRAAEGAVSKKLEKWMEPISEARVGSFHVRGYRGNTPEHHMAHLLQMGATSMPELVERWRTLTPQPPSPEGGPRALVPRALGPSSEEGGSEGFSF
jgi:hypothetical protein